MAYLRVLTSLSLLGVFGATIAWGSLALEFTSLEEDGVSDAAQLSHLVAWSTVPGLGIDALEATLWESTTRIAGIPAFRSAELVNLLRLRPMSSRSWLSLAEIRAQLRRPNAEIDAALEMSWITGPNEGTTMWQRGLFGMLRWEQLNGDSRRRVSNDIVRSLQDHVITAQQDKHVAAEIVRSKPPAVEDDIATALLVAGLPASEVAEIGLPKLESIQTGP